MEMNFLPIELKYQRYLDIIICISTIINAVFLSLMAINLGINPPIQQEIIYSLFIPFLMLLLTNFFLGFLYNRYSRYLKKIRELKELYKAPDTCPHCQKELEIGFLIPLKEYYVKCNSCNFIIKLTKKDQVKYDKIND